MQWYFLAPITPTYIVTPKLLCLPPPKKITVNKVHVFIKSILKIYFPTIYFEVLGGGYPIPLAFPQYYYTASFSGKMTDFLHCRYTYYLYTYVYKSLAFILLNQTYGLWQNEIYTINITVGRYI